MHSRWILSIDETVLSVSSGDIERCLGSEGEDEGSVWGMEVLDSRDAQDKVSLTASEGTEPGSPVPCALSPPAESWIHTQNTPRKDPEHCDGSMFSKSLSDRQEFEVKQRLQLKPKGFLQSVVTRESFEELFILQNKRSEETIMKHQEPFQGR